jgi:hypothetical protein
MNMRQLASRVAGLGAVVGLVAQTYFFLSSEGLKRPPRAVPMLLTCCFFVLALTEARERDRRLTRGLFALLAVLSLVEVFARG